MNISQSRFLVLMFSLVFTLSAQATTVKRLAGSGDPTAPYGSDFSAQFLQQDWNPTDGDTRWLTVVPGYFQSGLDGPLMDFGGPTMIGTFIVGDDPWETVSIKSPVGPILDLHGTQEIQLVVNPQYVTSKPYVSIVLRLTMQDGSIWDQPKVLVNNIWQTGAFPIREDLFARAEWGPEGMFDIGNVTSWEFILVDLPPNNSHRIEFRAVDMKGNYDVPPHTPDSGWVQSFTERFPYGSSHVLFVRSDWNPADGDTDWLYHINTHHTYYAQPSFVTAVYRSEGDPWETVSIRKEAREYLGEYFDLTTSNARQILAFVKMGLAPESNALIMSLTMEDGSVWQQGRPRDVVRKTAVQHYSGWDTGGVPYWFPLDPNGKGWTMAPWGPAGSFNLSRIKAWELSFNSLERGTHPIVLSVVGDTAVSSLVRQDNTFGTTGQAQWLETSFAADGVVAGLRSGGGAGDSFSITSETPVNGLAVGFNLEITAPYVNPSPDAVILKLTTKDGKIWQQAYDLPEAGRSVLRLYTSCPTMAGGTVTLTGDACKAAMGSFYQIDARYMANAGPPVDITKWEIILNRPPAGEHRVRINLLPTVW